MVKKPVEPIRRGPGRPSKNKRGTFKFRVTDSLRTKMEAAAKSSNRSVSEEIEHRLEQSFTTDFVMTQLLGGGKNATLLRLIAGRLSGLDQQAFPWHSHAESAQRLVAQIQQAMDSVSRTDTPEDARIELHRLSSSAALSSKAGMLSSEGQAHAAAHAPLGDKRKGSK